MGLIQLLSHYESIRFINSSIGVYIVAVYLIEKIKLLNFKYKCLIIIFFSTIYTYEIYNYLSHIRLYQLSSHNHRTFPYKHEISEYTKTEFNFFGKKKLRNDYVDYYEDITHSICSKNNIYNLSYDKTFNFICPEKKNTFKYNIFTQKPELIENLIKNSNIGDRVIISSYPLVNFKLIKEKNFQKISDIPSLILIWHFIQINYLFMNKLKIAYITSEKKRRYPSLVRIIL